MPYASNDELPERIRERLPVHAQDIFREAFNHAWVRHQREDVAHRVAWAAVKRKFEKVNGIWVARAVPRSWRSSHF